MKIFLIILLLIGPAYALLFSDFMAKEKCLDDGANVNSVSARCKHNADIIFTGKFTKILKEKRGITQHEFVIDKMFKHTSGFDDRQANMSVQTKAGEGCEIEFEPGKKYIVFGEGARLARYFPLAVTAVNTSSCAGTVLLESPEGQETLKNLNG